jgi:hypothetical protein
MRLTEKIDLTGQVYSGVAYSGLFWTDLVLSDQAYSGLTWLG